jgi:oxygen-independent coproporphyrinogen III oxidase
MSTLPPFSLYVHFPFCHRICPYCDFNVQLAGRGDFTSYFSALEEEASLRLGQEAWATRPLKSLYFGGGTPSLAPTHFIASMISKVAQCASFVDNIEITIEANPEDVTIECCKEWRSMGINRVSLGVQALQQRFLDLLKRKHTLQDVKYAVRRLHDSGFTNISVDYIFGLPDQKGNDVEADLNFLLDFKIPHLSTYELTIEKGTPFFRLYSQGRLKVASSDDTAEMMSLIDSILESAGYEHYEVSNYAQKGFRSIHNSSYWHFCDYLGLGAGAHSFQRDDMVATRWCNLANPTAYAQHAQNKVAWSEVIERNALSFEFVLLALRLKDGILRSNFKTIFGRDVVDEFSEAINYFSTHSLLDVSNERVKTSQQGRMLLDSLLSEPIWGV